MSKILRRYKTPAPKGRVPKKGTKKGITLNAKISVELMKRLLALAEEWATKIGFELDPKTTVATRERLQQAAPVKLSTPAGVAIGIHMPIEMANEVVGTPGKDFRDGLVHKQQRKKGAIVKACLEAGIEPITSGILIEAYPDTKPSLNLVALLAFTLGLQKFKQKFAGEVKVQAVAKQSAAAQRLAQKWSQRERRRLILKLERKSQTETVMSRKNLLDSLIGMLERESPEYLEKLTDLLEAEIGNA